MLNLCKLGGGQGNVFIFAEKLEVSRYRRCSEFPEGFVKHKFLAPPKTY
jgi:hypothetical protein